MSRLFAAVFIVLLAAGCDGMGGDSSPPPLAGTLWQVEDIDGGGIIDRSNITLEFPGNTEIAGSTGCNRYFGSLAVGGDRFAVSGTGSTRRACVPAIMEQEQRFLAALQDAATYAVEDDTWLDLFDAAGDRRVRAIRVEEEPATDDTAPDEPDGAV